ncbi:MAG: choice-of-anchor D domain-containing protein [Chlorobi bacterium]|nr:choice-of-anchor D domain-containing protein [Chlorobiota bacterium]
MKKLLSNSVKSILIIFLLIFVTVMQAQTREFVQLTTHFNSIDAGDYSTPTFTDIDGDGLLDLVIGNNDGTLKHYEQNSTNSTSFTLQSPNYLETSADTIDVGVRSAPFFYDIDNDGKLDLLIGEDRGAIFHYEQTSTNAITFDLISSEFNNITSTSNENTTPIITDLDGDNLLDLLFGDWDGKIYHYEQASPNSYTFTMQSDDFLSRDLGFHTCPTIGDFFADGKLDLVIGEWDNADNDQMTHWTQNSSNSTSFSLTKAPMFNNLPGAYFAPVIVDLDGDNLLDLIVGYSSGELCRYEATLGVSTDVVSNIEMTTADCGGNIDIDGTGTMTARGVCWSTSPNPTTSDSFTDGTGIGAFTASLTGLQQNTTYYVRAYVTNNGTTTYGDEKSFATKDVEIEVTGNAVVISDGDNTPSTTDDTDFGVVATSGGSAVHTFTIKNTGTNGTLDLTGNPKVSISGDNTEFTVTVEPSANIAANNGTTTFEITFDPTADGQWNAEVSIENNDLDENPFNFSITGIADNEVDPNASSYSPADDGIFRSLHQNLTLQFNETVTAVSGKNINIYDSGMALFEQIPVDDARVTISDSKVTINPNASFEEFGEYYVQIDAGAFLDILNNAYAGIQNSTTWNFTVEPNRNMLAFDGVDDNASLSLTLPETGTIECWFYMNVRNTYKCLWQGDENGADWFLEIKGDNDLYVKIGNSTSIISSNLSQYKWYHAAVTWAKDGASVNLFFYINGQLITTFTDTWNAPGSTFFIGMKASSQSYFSGNMDEFRIWSYARSIAEIQNDMFNTLAGTESNLLLYYRFNESEGSALYDETINGNDASMQNMADDDWITATSPVGKYGKAVVTTAPTAAGATGKTITADISSSVNNDNYLGIYAYGRGDRKVTNDDFGSSGATQRSEIIWGVEEFGAVTSDLVFDYSNIAGYSTNEGALKLLKRSDATSAWTEVISSVTQNTVNHTFTISGITDYSEFSVGDGGENPLPVELTSFTAKVINENEVKLEWQTATEVDNYGFEIERASSRLVGTTPRQDDWNKINFVQGHGNSNSPKEYSFIDKDNLSGTIHYRLKQIDADGSFEYFPNEFGIEIEIGLPTKFELFQNYPNPFSKRTGGNPTTTIEYTIPSVIANGAKPALSADRQSQASSANLQINSSQAPRNDNINVTLKVYNSLGEEVATLVNKQQSPGKYSVEFNGANLASGMYIYRLTVGNKFTATKKLLLLK